MRRTTIDPTRDELLAVLAREPVEPIDREAAIYWFCSNWHGGQWSNLYRALSASPYRPGPLERHAPGFDAERCYALLECRFLPRSMQWAVSTETVTEESAADGESESTDYSSGLTFRDAMRLFQDADSERGIEANSHPIDGSVDWFTAHGSQDVHSGGYTNCTLHVPGHVSPASRIRIARLLGLVAKADHQ